PAWRTESSVAPRASGGQFDRPPWMATLEWLDCHPDALVLGRPVGLSPGDPTFDPTPDRASAGLERNDRRGAGSGDMGQETRALGHRHADDLHPRTDPRGRGPTARAGPEPGGRIPRHHGP